MLCFIHYMYSIIHKPRPQMRFLRRFKLQKMKMKLRFESIQSQMLLAHMFQLAIFKTLLEKQRLAAFELQKSLKMDD